MKKIKVKMNIAIYLDMSILDVRKKLMYEVWYNYIKLKYQKKRNTMFNGYKQLDYSSNYSKGDKIPLSRGINKKVIGLRTMN